MAITRSQMTKQVEGQLRGARKNKKIQVKKKRNSKRTKV